MSPDVIDEQGRFFGVVNVVDLLVSLLFVSVVVAGAALVFPSGAQALDSASEQDAESKTVVVQTDVAPYVADAIKEGSPVAEDVSSVSDVRIVEKTTINGTDADSEMGYRVRFTVTLDTESDERGLPEFRDGRLYVGQDVRLDLGTTIVEGDVVEMSDQ